jgi:hypothetical protein
MHGTCINKVNKMCPTFIRAGHLASTWRKLQVGVEVSPKHGCSMALQKCSQVHVLVTHAYMLELWRSHRWDVAVDNNEGLWHSWRLQAHSQELHGCAWAGQLLHVLPEPFVHQNSHAHPLNRSNSWCMKGVVTRKCSQQLCHRLVPGFRQAQHIDPLQACCSP